MECFIFFINSPNLSAQVPQASIPQCVFLLPVEMNPLPPDWLVSLVIMKIPCMNKSMVIMNNGQLIINSLWSNSIHEQLFIKLLWTTDHAWTIGLSIWTIDHMANCSCMNKLFIIYEQLFIISKIVHKLFIAWTIGHSMDNPSDIHKILNGCFLLFRFITNLLSFF